MQSAKTFRVFVSSTFNDLTEERNALQDRVFPILRDWCRQYGARFQAIDLRWGVSEEAAQDHRTMEICLEEIDRCKSTTRRPNFLVMLGDRYGWRPLPATIPTKDFNRFREQFSRKGLKEELQYWYPERDRNAVPSVWCFGPRADEPTSAPPDQRRFQQLLFEAASEIGLTPSETIRYGASATEQEIARGLFREIRQARKHVHCFVRKIRNVPREPIAQAYIDWDPSEGEDRQSAEQLARLKQELRQELGNNVHEYEVDWTRSGINYDYLGEVATIEKAAQAVAGTARTMPTPEPSQKVNYCQDVYDSLLQVIAGELKAIRGKDALRSEIHLHDDFARQLSNAKFFTGRADILQRLAEYRNNDAGQYALALIGEAGSGKSTVMARAGNETRKQRTDACVITRFIGATPESSSARALLRSLCQEIAGAYSLHQTTAVAFSELMSDFQKALQAPTADHPLILFIDGVDQLSDIDDARNLNWLPIDRLSENVRIIVSAQSSAQPCVEAFARRLPDENRITLYSMPDNEGMLLLDRWLKHAKRRIQPAQRATIMNSFAATGTPLYLKFAFEEARLWRSFHSQHTLAKDTLGIVRDLFSRLSKEANHGDTLVERSLSYLASAKNGLSEDELIDILSSDELVMTAFRDRFPKSPKSDRLPVVLWSRLYFDLKSYLNERSADGTFLLSFFHRQLRDVVSSDYLPDDKRREFGRRLVAYFEKDGNWIGNGSGRSLNIRKLSELPFQQRKAEMWHPLEQTLCDLSFIEAKCEAGMIYDLLADYDAALESLPEARRDRVREFARFVRAYSHVLSTHPALTFQQALNEPDSTAPAQTARLVARADHRVHFRQINKRQMVSPCIGTFEGHGDIVNSCDVSVDNARIVTAASDNELKIWDAATGKVLVTLRGHGASVETCAFSSDAARVISGDRKGVVKIWDSMTGQELLSLGEHESAVPVCRFSHDGKLAASGSWDRTIKIWDTRTGAALHTLRGHNGDVYGCEFSRDGRLLFSGGGDGALKVWDVQEGNELMPFEGHSRAILSCALSSDQKYLFSASEDCTIKRWDVATRQLLATYRSPVELASVAVSANAARMVSGAKDGTVTLWDVETARALARFTDHKDQVWGVSFFPDGTRLVSVSWDLTVRVWDINAAERITDSTGSTAADNLLESARAGWAMFACVSSTKHYAAAGADGVLRLWNVQSGMLEGAFELYRNYVLSCAISSDGRWILSGDWDGNLKLWDIENRSEVTLSPGHKDKIVGCTFSHDGSRMASCSSDAIHIWTWNGLTAQADSKWQEEELSFDTCVMSPDGSWIVGGSEDGVLKMWDTQTQKVIGSFPGHPGLTHCVASPDGSLLVTAAADGTLKIWDVGNYQEQMQIRAHDQRINACNFSPDGKRVVSASWDQTLKVWDLDSPDKPVCMVGHRSQLQDACFTPDGSRVLSAAVDGTVRLWDARTGTAIGFLAGPASSTMVCRIEEGTARAASVSHRNTVKIWDGLNGQLHRTMNGHRDRVSDCMFSPDGTRLVSCSADATVKIWNPENGNELVSLIGHAGPVQSCAFSPDGEQVASASWDETVRLWDASTGLQTAVLTAHEGWVQFARYAADRLISYGHDKTIRIWDAATHVLLHTLTGHRDLICAFAISGDGTQAISGTGSGELWLWNIATGRLIHRMRGHTGAVLCCGFSKDGRTLVSGGSDRIVRVWETATGKLKLALTGHEDRILACVFTGNGKVLSGSEDAFLKMWDISSGSQTAEYWAGAPVESIAAQSNGGLIVIGDGIGQVHLLDLPNG